MVFELCEDYLSYLQVGWEKEQSSDDPSWNRGIFQKPASKTAWPSNFRVFAVTLRIGKNSLTKPGEKYHES